MVAAGAEVVGGVLGCCLTSGLLVYPVVPATGPGLAWVVGEAVGHSSLDLPPAVRTLARMGLFKRSGVASRVVCPTTGAGFLVLGTTHRQGELQKVGAGAHLFRLVRQFDNEHDPFAVAVVCKAQWIGWITAKNSRRYSEAIDRVGAAGSEVWVHGVVSRDAGGWLAEIDCPYPEEIVAT